MFSVNFSGCLWEKRLTRNKNKDRYSSKEAVSLVPVRNNKALTIVVAVG